MYVARVAKDGSTRLARPCPRCMKVMYEAGVREVVYTTDDGSYKIERVKDLPAKNLLSGLDTGVNDPVM
jgi:deoxycytidylate deaminase